MEDVENTRRPEEMDLSGKSYFLDVSLEEAETSIRASLKDAARSVIAVGHYLKVIRDKELYREAGYENVWDYAADRFGFSKSTASRYMTRNDKFSVGGNSPILAEEFREYSKAQLQEMLSLDAEQMSAVTPDMTVREIRELRRPKEIPYFEIPGQLSLSDFPELGEAETGASAAENSAPTETMTSTTAFTVSAEDLIGEPEEKLSAYGFPKRVYPADSLLTTPGCRGDNGQGYDCFNCHLECEIRQEYCRCVDATCGFPFPCQMVDTGKREILEKKIGERCQFIDLNLADHKAGDGSPVPCCKDCETPCEYACENSGKRVATSQQSVAADAQQETAGNAAEKQQDIPEKPKTEKCIHDGISRCTLSEEDKEKDGTGKDCAHHCCWNCVKRDGCNIECYASSKRKTLDDDEVAAEDEENSEQTAEPIEFDRKTLEDMIRNAQEVLDQMCDYWVENQPYTYAKYNMMIQAYKLLLKEQDESDQKLDLVEQQPELPFLKNDKQRAEFIDAYEEWPLWIDNQETGEKYYRYELPDGTSFVIKTYHAMLYNYDALEYGNYKEGYGENEQYLLKPGKFFRDCRTNRSTLIDKLKELQKAGS
ncbi:hypothetical protein GPK90_08485 [Clostridium sp. MCC344]|nr:hypothetical protein [Clostridium sp. MCC344]MBT9789370.1 hypothetical protein [Clostridium sp. MCC344]